MALSEFSLIDRYFKTSPAPGMVGVGDDAALMSVPAGHKLVVCKDVLVQGRHFFADVDPYRLGQKSLAVNLSDLAAMGATPLACLLGLALPQVDEPWLESFSAGLHALGKHWNCPLVGGDTTASEQGIFISVTALGTLPQDQPGLLRSAARVHDDVWISAELGAADVALRIMSGDLPDPHGCLDQIRPALESPNPRVALGQQLLGVAHAAIDISDGLTQDLGHILDSSGVGACLEVDLLPVHPALGAFPKAVVSQAVLHGGDVYELCFTAPPVKRDKILAIGQDLDIKLTRVGTICAEPGLFAQYADGRREQLQARGFDHFVGGDS